MTAAIVRFPDHRPPVARDTALLAADVTRAHQRARDAEAHARQVAAAAELLAAEVASLRRWQRRALAWAPWLRWLP